MSTPSHGTFSSALADVSVGMHPFRAIMQITGVVPFLGLPQKAEDRMQTIVRNTRGETLPASSTKQLTHVGVAYGMNP
jgi:hypothetical protein